MKSKVIAGVVTFMCVARIALGQTAVDSAELFERGKKLMDAGELGAACQLIQQSYDLEPKVGRLVTLAVCRDREGRIATALEHYQKYLRAVSEMSPELRENHAKRERDALTRVQQIEKMVPKLKLVYRGEVSTNVTVTVDEGDALARINTEWPLDPGDHRIIIKRGGRTEEPRMVTLQSGKPTVEVDLTPMAAGEKPLWLLKPGGDIPIAGVPRHTLPPLRASAPVARSAGQGTSTDGSSISRRALGIAAISMGGVGMVAGAVLGGIAVHEKGIADANCHPIANRFDCEPAGRTAAENTLAWGNASTAAFVVGGVSSVVGLVLLLGKSKQTGPRSTAAMGQVVGSQGSGFVSVSGVW